MADYRSAAVMARLPGPDTALSSPLAALVDRELNPLMDGHLRPVMTPRAREVEDAQRALPALESAAAPVGPPVLRDWLAEIAAGTIPQTSLDVRAMTRSIAIVVGELPMACFTGETVRKGLRAWKFFPAPAEVAELLDPIGERAIRTRDAVRRIAAFSPAPIEPSSPTADPEVIRRAAAEAKAILSAAEELRPPRAFVGRARPLSEGALLTEYDRLAAQGDGGAAMRASMIRKKLQSPIGE